MENLKQKLLRQAAKIAEGIVRREEGKWPPDCDGAYYQPERPAAASKIPPEEPGK